MKLSNSLNKAANATAAAVGTAAARYKCYLEHENAKVRAEAAAYAELFLNAQLQQDYLMIADTLSEAINNTSDHTHFCEIERPSQIYGTPPFFKTNTGLLAFRFRCHRFTGHGIAAADVRRILQCELNHLCRLYNYPALTVYVKFYADGIVGMTIVDSAAESRVNADKLGGIRI